MNTRHLQEFLVFSDVLSYTEAAERLFVTRPTLAGHIRALEEELGCKLVASDRRNVWLTSEGRRFVQTARDTLAAWEDTCASYRALADNLLVVRVASTNLPWIEGLVHQARRAIQRRHPEARIELSLDDGPASSFDALEARENDVVVVGYKAYMDAASQPSFDDPSRCFPLSDEEVLLLIGEDSRLYDLPEIRLRDLDGATFMLPPDIGGSWRRDDVAGWFARMGARVEVRSQPFASHTEYFAHDFGTQVGIVPRTLVARFGLGARGDFRVAGIADHPLRTVFHAVFREGFVATPRGRELFEEMRALA